MEPALRFPSASSEMRRERGGRLLATSRSSFFLAGPGGGSPSPWTNELLRLQSFGGRLMKIDASKSGLVMSAIEQPPLRRCFVSSR